MPCRLSIKGYQISNQSQHRQLSVYRQQHAPGGVPASSRSILGSKTLGLKAVTMFAQGAERIAGTLALRPFYASLLASMIL
jgi:hypothetical protein